MVYMGGESWCTTKHLSSDLKAGHVNHLLSYIYTKDYLLGYFSRKFYDGVVNYIFLR